MMIYLLVITPYVALLVVIFIIWNIIKYLKKLANK